MAVGASPVVPSRRLPEPVVLPRPVLDVPRADLPSYKPLVVPPSDLRAPPGVKGTTESDKPKPKPPTPPVPTVRVPYTELDVPVPDGIVLTNAATTDVVYLSSTLPANYIFK